MHLLKIFLTKFASKVTVIAREPEFTCAKSIADKVLSHPKIEVKFNTEILEANGEEMVNYAKFINNKDVITNFLGNLLTRAGGDIADKVNIILTNDTLYLEYIGHATIGYAEEVRDLEKIALKDLKGFSVISNENEELIKIKTLKKELIFIRNNSHNDNLALAMSKVIKDFQ